MKIEISSKKDNPFLKREELIINIVHEKEATAQKAALQQLLSKELGKEPEQIEIRNIFSEKGKQESKAKVFVWEEKKVKDLSKEVKKEEKAKEQDKTADESKKEGEESKEKQESEEVKEKESDNQSSTSEKEDVKSQPTSDKANETKKDKNESPATSEKGEE